EHQQSLLGNVHEGDWEGVTLFLTKSGSDWGPLELALSQHQRIAFVFQHTGGEKVLWSNVHRTVDTTGIHPDLYVGLGSHTTFSFDGVTTPWEGYWMRNELRAKEYHQDSTV